MNTDFQDFKMAASTKVFSVEEVLERVFSDNSEEDSEEEVAEIQDVDREKDKLASWLETFQCGGNFDCNFFKEKATSLLLPVLHLSSSMKIYSPKEAQTRSDVANLLCSSSISAAAVLDQEARLWLTQIYKRLAGRVTVRRPYYAEVNRHIPQEFFHTLSMVLLST